ncbi:MAG: FAD-dependent oxidoreductase [Candidatus Latescibacterota bacterium]
MNKIGGIGLLIRGKLCGMNFMKQAPKRVLHDAARIHCSVSGAMSIVLSVFVLGLPVFSGCGKRGDSVMRAYDGQKGRMVVLTGERAKIRNFYETDFVVLGGGLGGIAAALAICSTGRSVYLIEETDRIAGCFSGDGTYAFAENKLVESAGSSKKYRAFRQKLQEWYSKHAQLPPEVPVDVRTLADNLGFNSFCFGDDAALEAVGEMLKENIDSGQLTVLKRHKTARVTKFKERIASLRVIDLDERAVDQVVGFGYVDATVHGDLFPLAGIGYIAGSESRADTGEAHAAEQADSLSAMRIAACADSGLGDKGAGHCYVLEAREGGTPDAPGTVTFPVMQESRRIRALSRLTEQDISAETQKGPRARFFKDSVGIGYAPILLESPDGEMTAIGTRPFQIPLGALMPADCPNLLAGNANIGATRVAAGALRTPEVQWAIGEAAGYALSFYAGYKAPLHDLLNNPEHLKMFQDILVKQYGVPIYWYDDIAPGDPKFAEAQLKPFEDPSYHESANTLHWNK